MKSITIHNIEPKLAGIIEKKARQTGVSLNKMIKTLLAQAVGLKSTPEDYRKKEFEDLFGSWNEAEEEQFLKNVSDLSRVDPKDWE